MIDAGVLKERIVGALPGAEVVVQDLTGGSDHYAVEIISEAFSGLSLIKRHRLVYAQFQDVLGGALHALQLTTRTPDEVPS